MSLRDFLKTKTPESIKKTFIRPIRNRFTNKYDAAFSFWKKRFIMDHGCFKNAHYKKIMLAMAGEATDNFLKGKIVSDFGCGPRGSLVWATSAMLRIGIDVLADRYADEFTKDIISHGIVYLKSTEKTIPLPSEFVDIMFTLNAMDHVDNFSTMCNEIIRVLKPGGTFMGSFNLEEEPTPCEPQMLNEKIIREALIDKLEVQSYRVTDRGPDGNPYAPFFSGDLFYRANRKGFLWVKARKPSSATTVNTKQKKTIH